MNTLSKWLGKGWTLWLGGAAALLLAIPAMAATFVVTSTGDTVDANPGDGLCADAAGNCTLRAAVMETDALGGANTIDLTGINDPANPIILTIKGADENYEAATGGGTGFTAVATHDPSIGDLNITASTTIVGAGAGKTIIEWAATDQAAGTADRVFHVEAVTANVTVAISGVTIMNGFTPPAFDIETTGDGKIWQFKRHGGGIALGTAAATSLLDPTVTHGSGSGGGGGGGHGGGEETAAAAIDGVTLTDVQVLNCLSGGDGGGIYNAAPLTLAASVVSGNTATSNGGGIYGSALMNISQTTIGTVAGNAAFLPNHAENGGGIFDTGLHTTTINGSAIVGNTATGGGALAGRSTTIDDIENTTISANVARDTAGGITTNGHVNLKNVTIAGNQVQPTTTTESTTSGVGLSSFGSGQFSYVNTIFANNVVVGTTNTLANCGVTGGSSGANFLGSAGHNLEDGDSCNLTGQGDLKNTDPQLAALANNGGLTDTMAIPMASPAIDAGDNGVCPNNDQRGDIRPADGNIDGTVACDIGAFELFVHTADIHIDNMTAPDTAFTTDPVTVTVAVHNDPSATTTATGVQITTDPLPAAYAVTSADVTTPGGTTACTVASAVVTCPVGSLAPGETATATIVGTATAPGELAITATVSSTAPIDPNIGNNTASVHVAVTGNADMGVTATGATGTVNAGTNTDMSFTVTNNGPDPANNARVAAFLPAGLTYQAIAISQGTCTFSSADNSVDCAIGSMTAGASITGTLTVQGSVDGPVSTLFGVAAAERDQQPDNDTATVALQLLGLADLQLAMSASTTFPTAGQTLPVTLTVSNLSGADTRNVVETVTLPAGTTFVAAAAGSACTASGATVTCTLGGVRVGAQATTGFDVKVASSGVSTLNGTVSSDFVDPVASNNTASLQLTVVSANTGGGGGGCAYRPGGAFDPTLLGLLMTGLIGLAARRGLRREAARK